MAVKAESYKNWCVENISPQCWPRILLKSLDVIRAQGLQLKDFEHPNDSIELSPELMEALNTALSNLYDMQIEDGVLS